MFARYCIYKMMDVTDLNNIQPDLHQNFKDIVPFYLRHSPSTSKYSVMHWHRLRKHSAPSVPQTSSERHLSPKSRVGTVNKIKSNTYYHKETWPQELQELQEKIAVSIF